MSDQPNWEVYAIRYGHAERRIADNFLGGDPHDGPMPIDYFVWAIIDHRRTILVDTGFSPEAAAARGRTCLHPVTDGLQAIGADADRIRDVVITHLHYDHAGNTNVYPDATFHLQDVEMAHATGRYMAHQGTRAPYELDDTLAMVRHVYGGRVQFHDGDYELAPGVSIHRISGHAPGLQVVRVKTRRGCVVLASDATHFYANYLQRRAFPILTSLPELLEGYETLTGLAGSVERIIPGHDPLVLELYPPPDPALQGWITQLDRDPQRTDLQHAISLDSETVHADPLVVPGLEHH